MRSIPSTWFSITANQVSAFSQEMKRQRRSQGSWAASGGSGRPSSICFRRDSATGATPWSRETATAFSAGTKPAPCPKKRTATNFSAWNRSLRRPVLHRQPRYSLELACVVGRECDVERQRMSANPQVVVANRAPLLLQHHTGFAVNLRPIRSHLYHRDVPNQFVELRQRLGPLVAFAGAVVKFAMRNRRHHHLPRLEPLKAPPHRGWLMLRNINADVRVEHVAGLH